MRHRADAFKSADAVRDTSVFAERSVLEVETPLLSHSIGTDPQLEFFTTEYCLSPLRQTLFLQTSPEFAMKRLLAAGSGSIYQIGKAFRNGESGRFHNPEFTMLEWYRVGFTLPQLMDEIAELIAGLFSGQPLQETQRVSYQEIFGSFTGLDPLVFSYRTTVLLPKILAYLRQWLFADMTMRYGWILSSVIKSSRIWATMRYVWFTVIPLVSRH
jgi:tRNA synthetases class II (D, K and N).